MFFSIFFERREKENEKQHSNKIQRLRQIQILIKTSAHSSSIVLCIVSAIKIIRFCVQL